MLDGEQDVVDGAVDTARGVMLCPAAGGDDQHRPFARQRPFTIAVAPVAVAVLADAIGKTIGVNPVDPAFHNGGHREPPQRELENHRIRPQQLLLLGNDIRALGALFKSLL